jgi:hypothetical protein
VRARRLEWIIADIDKSGARLSSTQTIVLLLLAHHAGRGNVCFPSLETLTRKGGFGSDKTVRVALAALASRGLVQIEHGGQHRPNRYTLERSTLVALPRFQPGNGYRPDDDGQTGNGDRSEPSQTGNGYRSEAMGRGEPRPVMATARPVITTVQTGNGYPLTSQERIINVPEREESHASLPLPRVETGPTNDRSRASSPKPPAKTSPSSDHSRVIAAFIDVYRETHEGQSPVIRGPRDGKAVKELLSSLKTPDEAIAAIRRAFVDDFVRTKKPDLTYIAANVNAFRGPATTNSGRPHARANADTPTALPALTPAEAEESARLLRGGLAAFDVKIKTGRQILDGGAHAARK